MDKALIIITFSLKYLISIPVVHRHEIAMFYKKCLRKQKRKKLIMSEIDVIIVSKLQ